ncbi:hypothetical protein EZS27_018923 [termite gut metagenome]|uniref:Uncharacterized protein n=1 Tax=termite gut metagenome TaxID=433724 RepID=A0A5J4RG57_9ZZZZ
MIYLIDDNQNNQRERLGKSFVDDGVFNGYLTSIEKLEKPAQASNVSHLAFLKDAKCILLHATTEDYDKEKESFLEGSRTNAINIKELISQEGDLIPLAIFSNGVDVNEPIYFPDKAPNYISAINKNLFYEHLWDFVENYKNSGLIELRILAWGKNFRAKEVSKSANILLEALAFRNGSDSFKISELSGEQQVLKAFVETSFPDTHWLDFLHDLGDNPISINDFRNKINQIIESFLKYGKNIRSWK